MIAVVSLPGGMLAAEPLDPGTFADPPAAFRPARGVQVGQDGQAAVAALGDWAERGCGGIMALPPGGPAFLSDGFLAALKAAVGEAKRQGLYVWLYDEDGYPSGYGGNGIVPEHPEWEARGLLYDRQTATGPGEVSLNFAGEVSRERAVLRAVWAYPAAEGELRLDEGQDLTPQAKDFGLQWEAPAGEWAVVALIERPMFEGTHSEANVVGPRRLPNILDPRPTKAFLDLVYQAYARNVGDEFGKTVPAIFTDEPAINTATLKGEQPYPAVPWSDELPKRFERGSGYALLPKAAALFEDCGEQTMRVRYDFWRTVSDLVEQSYFRQIGDWCRRHKIAFTGHLLWEERLVWHCAFSGSAFQALRQMDWPGLDLLGAQAGQTMGGDGLPVPKLVSSAAHLYRRPQVMSESYAVAGENQTLDDFLGALYWQAALGVDAIVPFAWRGEREIGDQAGRLAYVLRGGTHVADVAVYYPIESVWATYAPHGRHINERGADSRARQVDDELTRVSRVLLENQLDFDYVDADSVAKARVEAGALRIADETFRVVVLPAAIVLPHAVHDKLTEFLAKGGHVVMTSRRPVYGAGPGKPVTEIPPDSGVLRGAGTTFIRGDIKAGLPATVRRLVPSDVTIEPPDPAIRYVHRRRGDADVYLFANMAPEPATVTITLRASGDPQLWDPESGAVTPVPAQLAEPGMRLGLAIPGRRGKLVIVTG